MPLHATAIILRMRTTGARMNVAVPATQRLRMARACAIQRVDGCKDNYCTTNAAAAPLGLQHLLPQRSASLLPASLLLLPASSLLRSAQFSTARATDPRTKPGDVTDERVSIPHFTQSSTRHPLAATHSIGTAASHIPSTTTLDGTKASSGIASDTNSDGDTLIEPMWQNPVPHAVYDLDAIADIEKTHHAPAQMHERVALLAVKAMRSGFDIASRYRGPGGGMKEIDWLHRCLFLETVAGVPGMVAGMARHLRSLRSLKRDYGWIHTLLEEAENERMHLLIFMNMKQPGWLFRMMVLGAQGVFFNMFFLAYLVSPRTCHRFVGYLEEEAVHTYTGLLKDMEDGHLEAWRTRTAPRIARSYYNLPDDATVFDMVKCVRADEANHRDVNHTFASLDQDKGVNPFVTRSLHTPPASQQVQQQKEQQNK